jgi:dihydrofolate reductase
MAKLIYSAITSLDGYVVDENGGFEWAAPDEQVHAFVNDLERTIGTYLYGRRLYEVMRYWETMPTSGQTDVMQDFTNIWQKAEKVVYSTTLPDVSSARIRIERTFDPEEVQRLKSAATLDLSVGGATLAGHAIASGIVDEIHQFLNPVVIGGGTYWLPAKVHASLELLDECRFKNGVVHLHYRVKESA